MNIVDCLIECEIVTSKNEAYRLLEQNAIKVDNQVVDKSFVFKSRDRELDVQSIESYEWYDWYMADLAGKWHGDASFTALSQLISRGSGLKRFSKRDLCAHANGILLSLLLSEVFVISRGKTDYWIVRLSEVSPEINEKLMQISLNEIERRLYSFGI